MSVWSKRRQERTFVATTNVDESAVCYGRRNWSFCLPAAPPELFARFHIIGPGIGLSVHDDLLPAIVFNDQRRRPAGGFIAFAPPDGFARGLVDRGDGRLSLVIPRHDDLVIHQCR